MLRPLLLATLAFAVAGCNRSDETGSVAINADDGKVGGALDGRTGELKVDLPGFKGALQLPKMKIDAADFDLNGVRLYPGSSIEGMNLVASDRTDAGVHIRFTSPAAPAAVRDWFAGRLAKVGYTLRTEGNGLVGTTDEKKAFRLDLSPQGDAAAGTIVIGT